jgi:hypothetical protein
VFHIDDTEDDDPKETPPAPMPYQVKQQDLNKKQSKVSLLSRSQELNGDLLGQLPDIFSPPDSALPQLNQD